MAKISELIVQTILEKENLLVIRLFHAQYRRGIISYYTKTHRKPRLMSKNLQGSSHRLLQLEGFKFMNLPIIAILNFPFLMMIVLLLMIQL